MYLGFLNSFSLLRKIFNLFALKEKCVRHLCIVNESNVNVGKMCDCDNTKNNKRFPKIQMSNVSCLHFEMFGGIFDKEFRGRGRAISNVRGSRGVRGTRGSSAVGSSNSEHVTVNERGLGRGRGRGRVAAVDVPAVEEYEQATSSNLPIMNYGKVAEYYQSLRSSELRQAKDMMYKNLFCDVSVIYKIIFII